MFIQTKRCEIVLTVYNVPKWSTVQRGIEDNVETDKVVRYCSREDTDQPGLTLNENFYHHISDNKKAVHE